MNHSLIDNYILHNQFGKYLGMDFKIPEPGRVEYNLTINTNHLATPNSVHGGVIAALIDAALGVAGLSAVCDENKVVSTVEYKLNFLSPVFLNDKISAVSKVEQKGKRLLIITCDVFAENRNHLLVAKAMGTFNAYPSEKAGY